MSDWVDSRVSICICCWDVVIGAEWHASLPSDENHFMKRDLPRFLHNLYDDCRGPPRLFLLDKYGPLNPFDKSSSFKAFMLFSLKRSDSYTDSTSSCCDDLPPSTLLALLSRQREFGQTHDFLTHFEHIDHCTLVSVKDALMSKQLAKHKTQRQIVAMRPLQKVEKLCDLSMLYLTNRLGCFMKPTLPGFTGDIHLLVIQGLTDGWLDPGLMGQEQGHV